MGDGTTPIFPRLTPSEAKHLLRPPRHSIQLIFLAALALAALYPPAANSKQLLDKRPESLSWLNNPLQVTNFYSLAPKKKGKNFILE